MVGPTGDVTATCPSQAARLELEQPVLTPGELQAVKAMDYRGWRTKVRAGANRV